MQTVLNKEVTKKFARETVETSEVGGWGRVNLLRDVTPEVNLDKEERNSQMVRDDGVLFQVEGAAVQMHGLRS